jgi:NADH-quinone oxidoreductase subunit L
LEILAGQIPWAQDLSLGILSLAGVGLFLGAVGKSAQFPLQLWLPDAMEGPTPVSALIHAATMVAAGVYLLAQVFFMLTPFTLDLIAYTGAITAFMGGVAALKQTDIKKVLAFSTISQLGFMVMAMGLGAYSAGIFHLITHAFFKAGLFLVAGTVIHFTHERAHGGGASFDAQDMRLMGGLRKSLPLVHICYLIMAAALVGIPLFSGFLSKEAILTVALERGMFQGGWLWGVPILALATVGLTAFYMFRQWSLVFGGTHRGQPDTFISNAKVPWSFSLPLVVLALLSIGFVYSPNPFSYLSSWLFSGLSVPENVFFDPSTIPAIDHGWIALCSLGTIAFGLGAGVYYAQRKGGFLQSGNGLLHRISLHNWYLDSLFQWGGKILGLRLSRGLHRFDSRILDRAVNLLAVVQVVMAHLAAWVDKYMVDGAIGGVVTVTDGLGRWSRSLQSGVIQLMVLVAIAGMTLLFIWMMI